MYKEQWKLRWNTWVCLRASEEVAFDLALKKELAWQGGWRSPKGRTYRCGWSFKCKRRNPSVDKPQLVSREQGKGFTYLSEEFVFYLWSKGAIEEFWAGEWQHKICSIVEGGLVGHDPRSGLLIPVLWLARDPWIESLGSMNLDREKINIVTNL